MILRTRTDRHIELIQQSINDKGHYLIAREIKH